MLELVSNLDDPARINKHIQGGRHAFVGQAINDFAILHAALEDPVQEIRCLQPWDGPKKEVSASTLQPHVRLVLTELVKQMEKRGLGRATTAAERINLVLDPRLKSCCEAVCLNGGEQLQQTVRDDMSAQFLTFDGSVRPRPAGAAGAGGGAAGADGPFAPSSAPSPAGGAAAGQTGADGGAEDPATVPTPAPARPDRLARIRAKKNQLVARPSTIPSASKTRTDADLLLEFWLSLVLLFITMFVRTLTGKGKGRSGCGRLAIDKMYKHLPGISFRLFGGGLGDNACRFLFRDCV